MPIEWSKSWGRKCLYGSMRKDSEALRGIWHDLMDIAYCVSPKFGYLEKYLDVPYTLDQISVEFTINKNLLSIAIDSFIKEGRIKWENNTLAITNCNRYQAVPLGAVNEQVNKGLAVAREIVATSKFNQKHKHDKPNKLKIAVNEDTREIKTTNSEVIDINTGEIINDVSKINKDNE